MVLCIAKYAGLHVCRVLIAVNPSCVVIPNQGAVFRNDHALGAVLPAADPIHNFIFRFCLSLAVRQNPHLRYCFILRRIGDQIQINHLAVLVCGICRRNACGSLSQNGNRIDLLHGFRINHMKWLCGAHGIPAAADVKPAIMHDRRGLCAAALCM